LTAFYPGLAPIDAYGNGGFRFAQMSHTGSLLILPSGIRGWKHGATLTAADFRQVFEEQPSIEFLLLGTGDDMQRPPREVREAFASRRIGLEPMSTGAAVRTYNVLLAEKRRVGAALIAVENAK
jgi:uncharacterized protein